MLKLGTQEVLTGTRGSIRQWKGGQNLKPEITRRVLALFLSYQKPAQHPVSLSTVNELREALQGSKQKIHMARNKHSNSMKGYADEVFLRGLKSTPKQAQSDRNPLREIPFKPIPGYRRKHCQSAANSNRYNKF